MTTASKSYERLLGEHLELREAIVALRGGLAALVPHAGPGTTREWASAIAERLVKLHEALVTHFREEEASGVLEELAAEFPEHARRLERLGAEHGTFLAEGREIVSAFLQLEERGDGSATELVERTGRLLDRLLSHEEAETTLMQRAYTEDIGTPNPG